MRIEYSDSFKEHMQDKGLKDVLIALTPPMG